MGGNKAWRARAITDLAVPRRPAIATPPNPGSTDARSKASLIASCPTTAVRGKAEATGEKEIVGAGMSSILGQCRSLSRAIAITNAETKPFITGASFIIVRTIKDTTQQIPSIQFPHRNNCTLFYRYFLDIHLFNLNRIIAIPLTQKSPKK
jgi:hypothetical protein